MFPFDHARFDTQALSTVTGMGEALARTICIARLLVEHGRTIDLTGLDRGVGLFCAKTLDLPPEAGRTIKPHLQALLAEADLLTEALRRQAGA